MNVFKGHFNRQLSHSNKLDVKGNYIISGSDGENTLNGPYSSFIWDLKGSSEPFVTLKEGHQNAVRCCCFLPSWSSDVRYMNSVITAGDDGVVRFWHAGDKKSEVLGGSISVRPIEKNLLRERRFINLTDGMKNLKLDRKADKILQNFPQRVEEKKLLTKLKKSSNQFRTFLEKYPEIRKKSSNFNAPISSIMKPSATPMKIGEKEKSLRKARRKKLSSIANFASPNILPASKRKLTFEATTPKKRQKSKDKKLQKSTIKSYFNKIEK